MSDRLFSADSALMRMLDRVGGVILLNLVFVATSLPLVTLGASLTALNSVALKLVRGHAQDSIVREYLRAFRGNLREGTKLVAAITGLALVLVAWYAVVNALVVEPMAQLLMLAVWFVLAAQLTMTAIVAFPYLATFDDPTRRVLRNALLMSWRHPLSAITALTVTALPVLITIFYPKLTGYGLLWLAIGFAAIACVTAMLFTRVFDRYIPAAPTTSNEKDDAAHALP